MCEVTSLLKESGMVTELLGGPDEREKSHLPLSRVKSSEASWPAYNLHEVKYRGLFVQFIATPS